MGFQLGAYERPITTFTKTNTLCENKKLHYRLGDLEKFREKKWQNEVLHFPLIPRNLLEICNHISRFLQSTIAV